MCSFISLHKSLLDCALYRNHEERKNENQNQPNTHTQRAKKTPTQPNPILDIW